MTSASRTAETSSSVSRIVVVSEMTCALVALTLSRPTSPVIDDFYRRQQASTFSSHLCPAIHLFAPIITSYVLGSLCLSLRDTIEKHRKPRNYQQSRGHELEHVPRVCILFAMRQTCCLTHGFRWTTSMKLLSVPLPPIKSYFSAIPLSVRKVFV